MTCIHRHTTLTIGNDVKGISAGSLATDVGVGEEIHRSHRLQDDFSLRSRETLKQRNLVHHFLPNFFLVTEQICAALVHDHIKFGLPIKMKISTQLEGGSEDGGKEGAQKEGRVPLTLVIIRIFAVGLTTVTVAVLGS